MMDFQVMMLMYSGAGIFIVMTGLLAYMMKLDSVKHVFILQGTMLVVAVVIYLATLGIQSI